MSRGNQREVDRARAAKRNGNGKKNDDGLTPAQRNERCVRACCYGKNVIMLVSGCSVHKQFCAARLLWEVSVLQPVASILLTKHSSENAWFIYYYLDRNLESVQLHINLECCTL